MKWMPNDKIVLREEIIVGIKAKYNERTGKKTIKGFYGDLKKFTQNEALSKNAVAQFDGGTLPNKKTVDRALDGFGKDAGATPELRDLLCYYAFAITWEEMITSLGSDYETELAQSNKLRGIEKDKDENSQRLEDKPDKIIQKPAGFRGWFADNKFALILPAAILIVVIVMLTMKVKENPVKEDFEKKQVETVLALYNKLKNFRLEAKFVLIGRYNATASWRRDSLDKFYESQIKSFPILQLPKQLFYDEKGDWATDGRRMQGVISSPDQIIDSFGPNTYLVNMNLLTDSSLPKTLHFKDLAFSSEDIVDSEIIAYAHSPFLPDSIKSWLLSFGYHKSDFQSLNKILAERTSEIIVIGQSKTIIEDFTGFTPLEIWYDPERPSQRINLTDILYIIQGLNDSIISYLKTKGISVE